MEQKLDRRSIDALLTPDEVGNDTLYDIIINNGLAAFQNTVMFDYACRKSVELYIRYNDGVHSNNIMQMYKINMGKNLYGWFHLCSIRIYGRRTPGYFLDHPEKLWQKVVIVKKTPQSADMPNMHITTERIAGAVNDLLRFYVRVFGDPQYSPLKTKAAQFSGYYIKNNVQTKLDLPASLGEDIRAISLYAEGKIKIEELSTRLQPPSLFAKNVEKDIAGQEEALKKGQYAADPERNIIRGSGERIYVIGAMDSDKARIEQIAKKNGYSVDIVSDYDKLTNNNINSLRYSTKYAGIIVGPMPHSIKGMGEYSSAIALLEQEGGFPPVVRATMQSNKLKLTKTSFTKALAELSREIWERKQNEAAFG